MSNSNLADKWFDAIDDIDDFLEQLVTINEQSLETSPSLKDFCQTIYVSMQNTSDLDYHDSNLELFEFPEFREFSDDISSYIHEMTIDVFEVLPESCISDMYTESTSFPCGFSFEINKNKELYSINNKSMNKAA